MSTSVFMKILETSPRRYDRGIRIITLGKDLMIKKKIVSEYISEGTYVLDIGVGTGTLAILCAQKGAKVLGFDKSQKMLDIASERVKEAKLENMITLKEMSVTEMNTHLEENSFDVVLATFVFSELSELEQKFALRESYRVLKPNGKLIIEDEVKPRSFWKRVVHSIIRLPLSIITYAIAQSLTKPLVDIERKMIEAGFEIENSNSFFYDSLLLIIGKKV